jgi:hypothetical protein
MNGIRDTAYYMLSVMAILTVLLLASAGAAPVPVQKTEVSVYQPAAVPNGPSRSGECWTDSIAVARSGVWRCMANNEIHDPCFSNPGLTGAVICDADPARNTAGIVLKLTKPLPKPSTDEPPDPRPWLVKLADGTICEIETGTTAMVNGIVVPYDCSDSRRCNDSGCPYMTGLAEHFKRGKVWTATKIAYSSSDKGLKLISRKRVAVSAVWK